LEFRASLLLTIVVVICLSACATQNINADSGSKSGTQATISGDSKAGAIIPVLGNEIGVTIESVDGKKVGSGTYKVSVDPGSHELSVRCRVLGAENSQELSVDAVAGAHYHLAAIVGGNRPVPCTSILEEKSKNGNWKQVPTTDSSANSGGNYCSMFRLTV
jgi:hypothetical protein